MLFQIPGEGTAIHLENNRLANGNLKNIYKNIYYTTVPHCDRRHNYTISVSSVVSIDNNTSNLTVLL